jgi:hypothetical protein
MNIETINALEKAVKKIATGVAQITVAAVKHVAFHILINVDTANTAYSSIDGVLYNKTQTSLFAYPAGKTDGTFIIPNSVTSIGWGAFISCVSLTSVTIPKNVTSIWGAAFGYCTSLTAINVDTANTAYSSIDGVLYNKTQTFLFTYPERKSDSTFTIPNSVTSIGDDAFFFCNNLASVIIPSSVTSIGDNAFRACTRLVSVTFQGTIASANFGTDNPFPGDLRDKFYATNSTNGTPGTYTTTYLADNFNNAVWTKQ